MDCADEIGAFKFQDPQSIDFDDLASSTEGRQKLLVWEETQSDYYDGCVQLVNGSLLAPRCLLRDANCPVLCLIDALEERGWSRENRHITHNAKAALVYDGPSLPGKRCYLQ